MDNLQLRAFMKQHKLKVLDVSVVAGLSIATVRAWLRPETSKAQRKMTHHSESLIFFSVKITRKKSSKSKHQVENKLEEKPVF